MKKNDWKKSALFLNEWWSGAHSHFKNGSERVSALIFFLVSEIWAKLKKLVSVEHVGDELQPNTKSLAVLPTKLAKGQNKSWRGQS